MNQYLPPLICLLSVGLWMPVESRAGEFGEWSLTESECCQTTDCCCCQCRTPLAERETLLVDFWLDDVYDNYQKRKQKIPIGIGAIHWFHEDLTSSNDGYGIRGVRGTWWWYVTADPSFELCNDRKVGAHLEYRLRDGDTLRTFYDSKFWSFEAYGYLSGPNHGTLKFGQIWKRFGLDWDGTFFGNTYYFGGIKMDPDYGLSWEQTHQVCSNLSVATYAQFFFHEDGVNGSFPNADPESFPAYNERNTGLLRVAPTWLRDDGSVVSLGVSGLVGQIESNRVDLTDETVAAWGVDLMYSKERWRLLLEATQYYGVLSPVNYFSGGPSDRNTNFLAGVHHTRGPVTYRCTYSTTIEDHPHAIQNMVVVGTTTRLTKNVDFYFEYIFQQVDGSEFPDGLGGELDSFTLFNSLDFTIHWRF